LESDPLPSPSTGGVLAAAGLESESGTMTTKVAAIPPSTSAGTSAVGGIALSKLKIKRPALLDTSSGPVFSPRFLLALLLILGGIAWIAYYYLVVRVGPSNAKAGGPIFMREWKDWNYLVGFGLLMFGLTVSAHPKTPLGRNRGVVIGMLGCFLLGLAWICTFYVLANPVPKVPVMNDLGNLNLAVGIAFMGVGFAFATRWE
jgi:drug/metabolite transporter (DMT)-like permease